MYQVYKEMVYQEEDIVKKITDEYEVSAEEAETAAFVRSPADRNMPQAHMPASIL